MTSIERPARRAAVARILLAVAAVSAGLASVTALAEVPGASPDQAMIVAWRAFGLPVFAVVFGLLAWRPRGYPGVFELAIAHELALTAFALVDLEATDATVVVVADGVLAAVLVAAYLLAGAHRSWSPVVERVEPRTDELTRA